GGTGTATAAVGPVSSPGLDAALQSDGKIVVAGYDYNGSNYDFALARFNAGGTPDSTFGSSGLVTTAVTPFDDFGWAVAMQSDGKIVAAGYDNAAGSEDFAVVRYNANGTLDTTFGGTGKVLTQVGTGSDEAYD